MAKKSTTTEILEIKPIEIQKTTIRIVGDTPLIMHAWSEKAKREMLEKQMKTTKTKAREAKNPVEDFIRSMYWLTARFGFPVTAFKQAAISAAYRQAWTKDKMSLRGVFFIEGDENQMVEIHSDPPIMREDMVRVGMGTADIRYRGEFRNWWADLTVSFNMNGQYGLEQVINVLNAGGFVCGVGEWRPERDGQYGMYHVSSI